MILKFTFQLSWFFQSDNLLPLVELTVGEFSVEKFSGHHENTSVSVINLITDDSNSESWGPPPMKKLKVGCTAAMLKYSLWIADPAFTCKVFDPMRPCFVLASDKGILCKSAHCMICVLQNQ